MRKILYALAGAFFMLASCQKDMLFEDESHRYGNGIALYLTVPEREELRTYSTAVPEEELIDNRSVYVLILDGNDTASKLLDFGVATEVQNAGVKGYRINFTELPGARQAYIIVNARDILDRHSGGWQKNFTTLGEISAALQTDVLPSAGGVITAVPSAHPMTGGCPLAGLSQGASIGSSSQPVALTPATVKVTVENRVLAGTGYTFGLEGANLGNLPEKGFIMPGQDISAVALRNYGKDGNVSAMIAGVEVVEGIQATQPLFGYESVADNGSFIIVKASYNNAEGYYKLGFYADAAKKNVRPLLRGFQYKVVIRQVLTAGYRTVEEAFSSPASNGIIYDINVDDGDSYDIITNGIQYLGVSNSEYIAYNSNYINEFEMKYTDGENNASTGYPLSPFTATILTYTADPSWNEGTVTASEGITLVDETLTKVSSIPLSLPQTEGGAVRKELKIFMSNEFKSGTIDIRIGNLHKVIKVRRELNFSVMGGAVSLGSGISFASARTLPDPNSLSGITYGDPKTYSLAYNKTGAPLLTGDGYLNVDPGQELFLQIHNRFRWKSTTNYCYGELYLHHSTTAGRAKVSFSVDLLGCESFGDYNYNPKYSVSGAFWKNSEKGERLVQLSQNYWLEEGIPALTQFPFTGRWQVRVLEGEDFIRLGEWDNSITVNNNHFEGDPESRPVNDGKLILVGKDPIIRFRIGLTSTNHGGANRYGLVQLIYIDQRPTSNINDYMKQSCLIFVRQGEEDDNVLTPGKIYDNYMTAGTFAAPDVKFSPYPLIDPDLGAGGPDIADHNPITDTRKPVFAPYPTYNDYQFQWCGDRFFNPQNPGIGAPLTNWDSSWRPQEFKELCPEGYITPPSEIGGSAIYNGFRTAFPQRTYGNAVTGFYLDGYQDRYLQVHASGEIESYAPYVSNTSGPFDLLFFNPETMASLYLSGSRFRGAITQGASNGDRRNPSSSLIWTSDVDPSDVSVVTAVSYSGYERHEPAIFKFGDGYLISKPAAMRIRCIKDPAK